MHDDVPGFGQPLAKPVAGAQDRAATAARAPVLEPVSLPAWQGVGARVLAGRAVHGLLAGGAANDR